LKPSVLILKYYKYKLNSINGVNSLHFCTTRPIPKYPLKYFMMSRNNKKTDLEQGVLSDGKAANHPSLAHPPILCRF